ncbi:MAG: LacI family DNA-binding transcriptional regulator [Acidimicrobiia bacterium]|nr:LacI family DNA-binding transcriptional regulator [Acidimicrobiia bacterium]
MNLTLEDIGRLAGVSRSTVSRVINDQASVSSDVRQRVQETIRRTGYTPNVAARSLVSGRSGVIGLVIPSRVHRVFEDPYFSRLIQGISAASNRSGTVLSLFLFQNEEEESELYPRVVTSRFLDGLILTATRMADPLLARVPSGELPIVMVGRPDVDGLSYVNVDNRGGALRAATHLCGLGYGRIGLVGAPVSTTAGLDRLNGFVEGLAICGKALPPKLRADGDFSEASGYRAMRELLPGKPDAVFAASDTMAIGALQALREEGIRVPQDIALMGFDGLPSSETSVPTLTTIRQPVIETGVRAVHLLNDLVTGVSVAPIVEILPVELVVRESCGALRMAPATGVE